MLHTNTLPNAAFNAGNSRAALSLFLELPPEIHFKIGALLDPQALTNIIQTCCQCKEYYDTYVNFIPFLKTEYQKQIPQKLSKEMFSFEARKRHNITFEHSNQFSNERSLLNLFFKDIIDQKSISFYSESELINIYYRFQEQNIRNLIESNLLSIEETKNLTTLQFERLIEQNIYNIFVKSKLSLNDIETLTKNQLEKLRNDHIYKLFMRGRLSLIDIECLTTNQFGRLSRQNIYHLFKKNKLSLKIIDNLTNDQLEKLRIYYIVIWIERGTLSLEDLENIPIEKAWEANNRMFFLLEKMLYSHSQISSLTKDQIYRMCKPNV